MLHYLDIAGALFSFISTFFYVLASEFCWPFGVVATVLNGTLYGLTGIYGDMSLEVIYFISMFYGWYEWRYGAKGHKPLTITNIKSQTLFNLGIIATVGFILVYLSLKFFTNSVVPVADAFTSVFSLVAQWLTCRKILECWIVWFAVDAVYVVLYFDKGLPVHSLLLLIYVAMAIIGYWRWAQLKKRAA